MMLGLLLAFVTTKELITIFTFGKLDITFLLGLGVAIITLYTLNETLKPPLP